MNKTILMVGMGISTLAFGQQADRYADFSAQKKSIVLNTSITMKYIETGNVTGTPLILLHGLTDSGRSFQLMVEELIQIDEGLRIIAPDLRGHGETSMPDESKCAAAPENCFTVADFALDVIALMDQKGIPKAHILGHSMGSVIAQELALNYAERIHSLMLVGTFVDGRENSGLHEFLMAGMVQGTFKPLLENRSDFQWPKDAYIVVPDDLGVEVTDFYLFCLADWYYTAGHYCSVTCYQLLQHISACQY